MGRLIPQIPFVRTLNSLHYACLAEERARQMAFANEKILRARAFGVCLIRDQLSFLSVFPVLMKKTESG